MKLAILGMRSRSAEWLVEEAESLFDQVSFFRIKDARLELNGGLDVLCDGKSLSSYDAVHLRGSFRYADFLRAAAKILRAKGVYVGTRPNFYHVAHNKFLTAVYLGKAGIPTPKTFLMNTVDSAKEVLRQLTFPVVIKLPAGTHGKGVMFADDRATANSILDTLETLKQPIMIQEYVETAGRDVRAIVVGNKVVAAMERIAEPGEQRANIHAGGKGKKISLDSKTARLAIDATNALGASICAVDILQSVKGPLVVEVNASPGLQGITKTTGINVAEEIVKFIHTQTKAHKDEKTTKTYRKFAKEKGLHEAQDEKGDLTLTMDAVVKADRLVVPEKITKVLGVKPGQELHFKIKKGKIEIENPESS